MTIRTDHGFVPLVLAHYGTGDNLVMSRRAILMSMSIRAESKSKLIIKLTILLSERGVEENKTSFTDFGTITRHLIKYAKKSSC